jgi:ATP-binding cassette subfamily C protein CydD
VPLLWGGEVVAQRAAGEIETDLRERLAAALAPRRRSGESGLASSSTRREGRRPRRLVTRYVPRAFSRSWSRSWWRSSSPRSTLVSADPADAGPVLVLLLGLIGRRVCDLAERREHELAWMNAHFLDVMRGLPTLKMFGRSAEQAATIRAVSRRQGSSTMDVLRTAFQTTLVLEWGATAATALVAIETSVRLMAGGLTFERALAVLLLTPEFFLPLRRLSAEYHVGRSATAAAERVYAVLDAPVRIHVPAPGAGRPLPARMDVRFDDVVVTYDDGSRTALAGCSLESHGRMVACRPDRRRQDHARERPPAVRRPRSWAGHDRR